MFKRRANLIQSTFRRYYFPTLLMAMSLSMGVIVDGIIVGNILGSDSLAAVNIVLPIILLFNVFMVTFGIGGATLTSQAKGQRDNKRADRIFTASIIMMIVVSLLVAGVGILSLKQVISALTDNKQLAVLVAKYLRITFYGAPVLIVIPGITYFLRADGFPALASTVLIIANVINLSCDLIYIKCFGMDIRGAALATVTGYATGFCVLLAYFLSNQRSLRFKWMDVSAYSHITEIVKTGTPSALGIAFLFIKVWCINSIVLATMGKKGMVAFSICLSCLSFVSMFISGSAQTMMPIVGTLFGEKDYTGIEFVIKRALLVVIASCVLLVLFFELFPSAIITLFGVSDPVEIKTGSEAIRVFALSLIGTGFTFMMLYYYQTIQQILLACLISVINGIAIVVPAAYLLSHLWNGMGIWLSFLIAEVGTFITILIATFVVSKKSAGKFKGIFLFDTSRDDAALLDVTIHNEIEQATGLSERVIQFCKQHNLNERTAMYVGLAVEEMSVNTIEYSCKLDKKYYIDINVNITDEDIVVGFKDDGIPFDPTVYQPEEKDLFITDGIALLKALATDINYSRSLGLNSTIIRLQSHFND